MEFGIGIHSDVVGRFPFEDIIKIVRLSEEEGLDYVAVPDIKFARDYVAMLTLIALNSKKVKLGTMLTDPFSRNPALTAVALGTIDEISGGRAFLGLGAGEFDSPMGVKRENIPLTMKEAVEAIKALWTGETVNYDGQTIKLRGARILAKVRKDIPVFIWSGGPKVLQTAGEVADCALINSAEDGKLKWGIEQVKIGAKRAGRDPSKVEIGAYVYSNIDKDSEKAKRILMESAAHRTTVSAGLVRKQSARDFASSEIVKTHGIAGTVEEVISGFRRIAKLGIKRAMIRPCVEDTPQAFEKFIKTFEREVKPQIK